MAQESEKKVPIWPVVGRLVRDTGSLRTFLYAAIVIDLIQAAFLLLSNHFMRSMFDAVQSGQENTFWYFVWISLALNVVGIPFSFVRVGSLGRFSEGALAKLRSRLAHNSARLPIGYLEGRHSGDMLSVLNADLGKLKNLFSRDLLDLVSQSVRGIAALVYIISINWVLALVTIISTPLIFIVISTLSRPVSKSSEEMQEEIGEVNSVAQDALSGSMVVKAFNLTTILEERFRSANNKALGKGLHIAKLGGIIDGFGMGLSITPFIIAVGLGGYFILQGQMTFGALFAFINLLNFVVNPLGYLPRVFSSISEAAGAGRRVYDLLDQAPERAGGENALPAAAGETPAIAFQSVTFGYKADEAPIIKNLSLDIPAGQTVAIVGPSGGGKSTLLRLILGYYPPAGGSVRLFGRDLNAWELPAARSQMAFVAQDTYLFPESIGENIRLGKPAAAQAEVEQAARLANIHDFIVSLPQGYDTPAGEWGSRLSGGQKQRIALARAILKDAPILLLDEPTSALDTESERLVQQALDQFSKGRTTLVIAHRLSTIKNADRVIVISDGEVAEQGSHEELLKRGGLYLELYKRQFEQAGGNGKSLAVEGGMA